MLPHNGYHKNKWGYEWCPPIAAYIQNIICPFNYQSFAGGGAGACHLNGKVIGLINIDLYAVSIGEHFEYLSVGSSFPS
jgi:hypothetical protein